MAAFGPNVIQTASGRFFAPLDPDPEDVILEDIAHALSNQCRFSGHTRCHYSVSEHAVRVSKRVEEILKADGWMKEDVRLGALCALHHDDSEAYLVDLPRPLKRAMGDYRAAEARVEFAIQARFDLVDAMQRFHEVVKRADDELLATEARDLMKESHRWGLVAEPLVAPIMPWTPDAAKARYLGRHAQLGGGYARKPVAPEPEPLPPPPEAGPGPCETCGCYPLEGCACACHVLEGHA